MRRKIYIAQMLLAQSEVSNIKHLQDTEDGYIYSVKPKSGSVVTVRVKPGGTVAIKKGEDWETIDLDVPYDITVLQESSMSDFHTSLMGWLGDSRKFKEETH